MTWDEKARQRVLALMIGSEGKKRIRVPGNQRLTSPWLLVHETSRDASNADTEAVALASQELATNLLRYAIGGRLVLSVVASHGLAGIEVESQDDGPGIPDIMQAMADGYSTGGGLGSGLPGVRRLMDEFSIRSGPEGTNVVTRKWLRGR